MTTTRGHAETLRQTAEMRIPLHRILLKPNIPAGMDAATALGLVKKLRTSNEDWHPVLVRPEGDNYRLLDGRHRFFASVIAGRTDILATCEDPTGSPNGGASPSSCSGCSPSTPEQCGGSGPADPGTHLEQEVDSMARGRRGRRSRIKIKKSNQGKLRKSLGAKKGSKIPMSKLKKAANSSNPTTRKRAQFAINARKWNSS